VQINECLFDGRKWMWFIWCSKTSNGNAEKYLLLSKFHISVIKSKFLPLWLLTNNEIIDVSLNYEVTLELAVIISHVVDCPIASCRIVAMLWRWCSNFTEQWPDFARRQRRWHSWIPSAGLTAVIEIVTNPTSVQDTLIVHLLQEEIEGFAVEFCWLKLCKS